MLDFILKNFITNINTISRCINKSTYVYFDTKIVLLCSDDVIFYFGADKHAPRKIVYKFVLEHKNLLRNKIFYSHDVNNFKNHCIKISDKTTTDGDKYKWTF